MFDQIESSPDLFGIERSSCEENELCVLFCEKLKDGNEVNPSVVKILKPDEYYNSKRMHNPPPAIDCLIIVKLTTNEYNIYLIELRNVKGTALVKPDNIRAKFLTVVDIFMSHEYNNIFLNEEYNLVRVEAWLVTDPFGSINLDEEQYRRKIKGTVLEKYASLKPLKFRGKIFQIQVKRPGVIVKYCGY